MDWSEEGIDEELRPSLSTRAAGGRLLPPPRARAPSSGSEPPRSASASPHRGGLSLSLTPAGSRSPSPRRAGIVATRTGCSVRTTSRSPPRRTAAGDDTGVEEVIAEMREGLPAPAAPASGSGPAEDEDPQQAAGGVAGFSFQGLGPAAATPVDGAEVLDAFAGPDEARKARAKAEFVQATMGANTGPRTQALKTELVVNRPVLDLAGLERWMRRTEAVAELDWFTGLCGDGEERPPPIDLFECAFQALENANAHELHRGAHHRKRWLGSVGVPDFFFCPVSDKIMENPVVLASGKTVDRSALEEWWHEHGRICPVTNTVLEHTMFIPNILIKLCIARWRVTQESDLDVPPATDPSAIDADMEDLFKEFTLLPQSPRSPGPVRDKLFLLGALLAGNEGPYARLVGRHPETITKLASVLAETCLDPDPELDDVIVGILEKAASYGPNKAAFGDDQYALPVLIARSLLGPSVPMRARCAHILGQLADDRYNKIKIGELGGFAPLVELLRVGDKDVKVTAAQAIASLSQARENRSRFQREGVVDAIISAVRSDGLMVHAQAILVQTVGYPHAMREVMSKLDAVASEGDEMCWRLKEGLWGVLRKAVPEGKQKHGIIPSLQHSDPTWYHGYSTSTSGKSSTSSEASADEKALRKQLKEDVKIIVPWLQKRRYFPRTYRYRED